MLPLVHEPPLSGAGFARGEPTDEIIRLLMTEVVNKFPVNQVFIGIEFELIPNPDVANSLPEND